MMSSWTVEWLENYFEAPIAEILRAAPGQDLQDFLTLYVEQTRMRGDTLKRGTILTNLVGTRLVGNFSRSPIQNDMDRALGLASENAMRHRSMPDLASRLLLTSDQVVLEDPLLHVWSSGRQDSRVLAALEQITRSAPLLMRADVALCTPPVNLGEHLPEAAKNALSQWESFGEAMTPLGVVSTTFPEFPTNYAAIAVRSRAVEQVELAYHTLGHQSILGWPPVWTLPTERERRAFLGLLRLLEGFDAPTAQSTIGRRELRSAVLCELPIPDTAGISPAILSKARHSDAWAGFREQLKSALDELVEDIGERAVQQAPREVEEFRRRVRALTPSVEIAAPLLGAGVGNVIQWQLNELTVVNPQGSPWAVLSTLLGAGATIMADTLVRRAGTRHISRLCVSLAGQRQ